MFALKIQSRDVEDIDTEIKLHQNICTIGGKGADLFIDSPFFRGFLLQLEIRDSNCLLTPLSEANVEASFQLNGKRAQSERSLQVGDKVSVGKTTIELLQFSHQKELSKKEALMSAMDQQIAQKSPLLSLFQLIQQRTKGGPNE